jgi:hypothetical protein
MRGGVYLEDGAVDARELAAGGLHRTPQDERGWHLVMLDAERRITGCIWYLEHDAPATMEDLRISASPLAVSRDWGTRLRDAIESDILRAEREGVAYGEVGGWAVSRDSHCSVEGVLLAVAAYGLSRLLGNAIGVTTATSRHSSARILRRLGLMRFAFDGIAFPAYYDPKYRCDMELLRFDSRVSSPRFEGIIDLLQQRLPFVPVVSATNRAEPTFGFPYPVYTEPGFAA